MKISTPRPLHSTTRPPRPRPHPNAELLKVVQKRALRRPAPTARHPCPPAHHCRTNSKSVLRVAMRAKSRVFCLQESNEH